ncbi:hypothetical protein HZS61_013629 [Fusarium oxysporum f. sp. conglutinans]|uniref:Uncharacterized protein n=1 Tax=Fusarium oxysporum f. sp. conglutinans TaxID=100902 RepID=A0A8H6GRI8_FUSOX|nr:hypothetical protein HZS61_013629 [Fusarium oxysporum f. sp. conglutinans]
MDEPDGTDPNRSVKTSMKKIIKSAWVSSWRFNAHANDVPEVNSLSTHLATTGQPGNAEPGTGELQPFASDDNPSTTEQHNTESGKAESNVNQTAKTHLRLPLELREIVYCCAIRRECVGMEMGSNHRFIHVVPETRAVVFLQD